MKSVNLLIAAILLTSMTSFAEYRDSRSEKNKNIATFTATTYACSTCESGISKKEIRNDAIADAQDKGIEWCNQKGANGVRFYGAKTRVTPDPTYYIVTASVTVYCVFRN